MSTSAQVREAGSTGASARPDAASFADVAGPLALLDSPHTVPTQTTPSAGQSVVVAPPRAASRASLGTQALVTALVVRSCQPGALRTTLDGIAGPAAR